MNIGNSEAKIGVVHELGCRLDDNLEATTKDMYRAEGASSALKQAVAAVENSFALVDKDTDAGKIDLEAAKNLKSLLERTRSMINSLASNAETNRVTLVGKMQGLQMSVTIAKKFKDDELNKVKALQAALMSGVVQNSELGLVHTGEGSRPTGVRPGMSIKERRLAEAKEDFKEVTEKSEDPQKEDVVLIKSDLAAKKQKAKKEKK